MTARGGARLLLLGLGVSFAIVAGYTLVAGGGPPARISFLSMFACFGYASIAAHYWCSLELASPRRTAAAWLFACVTSAAAVFALYEWRMGSSPINAARRMGGRM